jgi:hypothetical protein
MKIFWQIQKGGWAVSVPQRFYESLASNTKIRIQKGGPRASVWSEWEGEGRERECIDQERPSVAKV